MWEIVENNVPYWELSNEEVFQQLTEKNLVPPHPSRLKGEITSDLWKMVERCFDYQPGGRPEVDELAVHILGLLDKNFPVEETNERTTVENGLRIDAHKL